MKSNKVVAAVDEFGKIEMEPRMEGSYMRIMIAPNSELPVKKPLTPAQPEKKQQADDEAAPVKAAKAKSGFVLDADKI